MSMASNTTSTLRIPQTPIGSWQAVQETTDEAGKLMSQTFSISSASSNTSIRRLFSGSCRRPTQVCSVPCVPITTCSVTLLRLDSHMPHCISWQPPAHRPSCRTIAVPRCYHSDSKFVSHLALPIFSVALLSITIKQRLVVQTIHCVPHNKLRLEGNG